VNRGQLAEFSLAANRYSRLLGSIESSTLYHYAFFTLIFLFAVALRFYKLGEWSLWIDEIYSLQAAQSVQGSGGLFQPISTHLINASISSFGTTEWSLRLAPALIGLASLPVLYILARKLFDRQVALIAVALLAISPWHLYWSQNARFYTTLLLFYLVALIAFFWGMETNKRRFLLLSLVLLGLAMFERMFAAFLVPVIICYVVLLNVLPFEKRLPYDVRKLLAAIAIPILIFALYDAFQLIAGGESRIQSFLVKFVGNPNKSPLRFLASFVYHLGIPVLCVGSATGLYLIKQKKRVGLYLLISAVLPPLVLTLAASFIFTADRYAFISLPGWIILTAVGIKHSLTQSLRYRQTLMLVIPLIVVTHSLVENTLYYQYQRGNRPDWQNAYSVVKAQIRNSDVVYSTRPEIGAHYLEREVIGIANVDRDTVLQAVHRTWFITSLDEIDPALEHWVEINSQLIEVVDVYIPGNRFSLRIYLYEGAAKTQGRGQIIGD